MALEMLGMNVLVKEEKTEKKTESGLFIPETVDNSGPLTRATVVNVGPGELQYGEMVKIEDVKAGDTVLIDRAFTKPVQVDGQECLILLYRDILGKES